MAERIVRFSVPNALRNLVHPKMVCTDIYIVITHFNHRNDLYIYSMATHTWETLDVDISASFFLRDMVIFENKYLVFNGFLFDESINGLYRTYMGDITERPIRFRSIGTLEPPAPRCNIATDGSNHLCAAIPVPGHNFHNDNNSIELFMLRTDTVNRWTHIPCDLQQYNLKLTTDLIVRFIFAYEYKIYIFPKIEDDDKVDFSKFIAVDLRTGRSNMVALRPADGPLPGFPLTPYNGFNISLVRCPVEPGHAYLVFSNAECRTSWEVWRIDVDAAQWHRLPPIVDGPRATVNSAIYAAIAPSGRLYVVYGNRYFRSLNDDYADDELIRRRTCDLFRLSIRVPPLVDLCLDLAMEYLRTVDPDWPRARTVQNVRQWINGRPLPEIDM